MIFSQMSLTIIAQTCGDPQFCLFDNNFSTFIRTLSAVWFKFV